MSPGSVAHRIQYVGYLALTRGIRLLPHRWVGGFGAQFGRLAYRLLGRRRRLTLENLAGSFPDLKPAEREAMGRACFAFYGRFFLESFSLERFPPDEVRRRFDVEGAHHLEEAKERGRGVLVIGGHFGANELALYPLTELFDAVWILVRPQNNPYVAADIDRVRIAMGVATVPRRRSAHRMLNILRRGEVAALTMDQRVRPSEGLLVPFLGRFAWTTRLPAQLSVTSGAAVVPVSCVPSGGGRYRVVASPPILPQGKGEAEVFRLTCRYVEALEAQIAEKPELWFWLHTRWRRLVHHRWPAVIARLESRAGLPEAPPLADLAASTPAARRLAAISRDVAFFESCGHVALCGGSRSDRCQLAAAFGRAVVQGGIETHFLRLEELLEDLAGRPATELPTRLREEDTRALLVIEAGELAALSEQQAGLLDRFLVHRRERGSVLLACDSAAQPPAGCEGTRTWLAAAEVLDLETSTSTATGAHAPQAARPETGLA